MDTTSQAADPKLPNPFKTPEPAPIEMRFTPLEERFALIPKTPEGKLTDEEALSAAVELLKTVTANDDQIVEEFKESKGLAHQAHKAILSLENRLRAPNLTLIARLRGIIGAFQTDAKVRAQAEQRRLEAEANKRREDEVQAKALKLEAAGRHAEAIAVIEKPIVPARVSYSAPKVEGLSEVEVWEIEVLDITKLNPAYLLANEAALRSLAKSLKGKAADAAGAPGAVRVTSRMAPRLTGSRG